MYVWSRGYWTGKERGQRMTEERRAWVEISGGKGQGVTKKLKMTSEVEGHRVMRRGA